MIPRYRPPFTWKQVASLLSRRSLPMAELEAALSKHFHYPQVVWFPYARVGIQAFLECLSPKPTQAVLSPFNCVALGNAIVTAGVSPWYVDTESHGFNQDPQQFIDALRSPHSVGIPVSLWGHPAPDALFRQISRPILHDFALRALDRSVAPLKEEDAVVFSLGWGKPVVGLHGGFLAGNSPSAAKRWRDWRSTRMGRGSRVQDFALGLALKLAFQPALFGAVAKFSERSSVSREIRGKGDDSKLPWNAEKIPPYAVYDMVLDQLARYDSLRAERLRQTTYYHDHAGQIETQSLILPPSGPSLSHYAVRSKERERLAEHLRAAGIYASRELFDRLLVDFPRLRGNGGEFPKARILAEQTIQLPLYFGLPEKLQQRVVDAIRDFYLNSRSVTHVNELRRQRISL